MKEKKIEIINEIEIDIVDEVLDEKAINERLVKRFENRYYKD